MKSMNQSFLVDKVGIFFTPEDTATIVEVSKDKLVEIVGIDTLLTLNGNEYIGRCPECGKDHMYIEESNGDYKSHPCFSVTPSKLFCKECELSASNPIEYLLERGVTLPSALLYLGVKLQVVDPPRDYQELYFYK